MAADASIIGSAGTMFKDGAGVFASEYSWVLWFFVGLAIVIAVGAVIRMLFMKKKQWTHNLKYRRVLENGLLSSFSTIKMRRFPLIKRAEVFELETALLGGFLMPELDSYTGKNEFSIIIDANNRIYTDKGSYFNPDKSSSNVTAKHAEIDIARSDLRADYQNINKVNKRVDLLQIMKTAMWGLLIIAVMVVAIKGIGAWGDNQEAAVAKANAEVETYRNLNEAMETIAGVVNTQLILIDELKDLKGTNNIQGIIREAKNETS